jgi:histidine triad (HIT) family protein
MECVFCKIAHGELPTACVFENDELIAFRDQNPQAPLHVLIIPKKHIATLNDTHEEDAALLGKLVLAAQQIAKTHHIDTDGYRLIFNVNQHGGQTVYHIHLHLLGGRHMTWPPG